MKTLLEIFDLSNEPDIITQNLNMQTTTEKLIILHGSLIRNLHTRKGVEDTTPPDSDKESYLLSLDEIYYSGMKEINSLAPQPSINQQIDTNGGPY